MVIERQDSICQNDLLQAKGWLFIANCAVNRETLADSEQQEGSEHLIRITYTKIYVNAELSKRTIPISSMA